jgi:hypothetical protein
MPTPTIPDGELFFNATLYTGNNATNVIVNGASGQSFQPDFVWIKIRSTASSHGLYNSVTTIGASLRSNSTAAETTPSPNDSLTSFNANGFTLGANNNTGATDINFTVGATYVAWQWKAGGAAVTNTSGSISSQVSANTTSGFSIATFTAQSSGTGTFGHGLGVAPSMVIVKQRASTGSWGTYHISVGNGNRLLLDSTAASVVASSYWNNTSPSSTVVTLGTGWATGGTMVAYCWAPIAGYSAFGSYTGNGSTDGPFIYLGFRPKFFMFKDATTAGNWVMCDSTRNTSNLTTQQLYPNLGDAEFTGTTSNAVMDFLSNGVKFRGTGTAGNASGDTFIYAAFAENPFKYANAR